MADEAYKLVAFWCAWSIGLWTERLPIQFLVRAHAWVVGQVPSWGKWGNLSVDTPMFLSFSSSLHFPFSKNKILKKKISNDTLDLIFILDVDFKL